MGKRKSQFSKVLGPGILFAGTSIGVSHLVQSTRAGADYGFSLILFIILANVSKYPFFEFGSRYANATGTSILAGYRKKHPLMLVVYLLISLTTMFTVTAAVTYVTAGLLGVTFGISWSVKYLAAIIFAVSVSLLLIGQYKVLDGLLKVVGMLLLITTIWATIATLSHGPVHTQKLSFVPQNWSLVNWGFVIALMGWMPTAVDLSAWNSLWTLERIKQTQYRPTLKETILDFDLGYWITAFLSLCFVTMGCFIIYGSGEHMPDQAVSFSDRLIHLYTVNLGSWSYLLIAIAALSTMFSTSITVLDGYSRSMVETLRLLFPRHLGPGRQKLLTIAVFLMTCVVGYLIIAAFATRLAALVDLATTLSFLVAPVIAIFNYTLVFSKDFPEEARPGKAKKLLAIFGCIFLIFFTLIFILWKAGIF